jgi:hypothetical protein
MKKHLAVARKRDVFGASSSGGYALHYVCALVQSPQ